MDQIGANTLKMLPNMIKICKQKWTETFEKTHASFPMSTVRIEMQKGAQYKWPE